MEPLLVRNEATGHKLRVEDHAWERWGELHGHSTDDISVSLGRAIPFGGQLSGQRLPDGRILNEGMLLLDGEVVFAAELGRAMVIRTVLTKAMALGNMQAFIGSARKAAYYSNLTNVTPAEPAMPQQQEAAMICRLNEQSQAVKRLSNEQLEQNRQDAMFQQQHCSGKKLAKAYGRLRNALEYERSQRGLSTKYHCLDHATSQEIEYASIKKALRELLAEGLLDEDMLSLIYKRAESIRERMREEARCKVSA